MPAQGPQLPGPLARSNFGPLRFRFELRTRPSGVMMIGWGMLGQPFPRSLGPNVSARVDEVDGRYRFRVLV
jgi:hypothetical protein